MCEAVNHSRTKLFAPFNDEAAVAEAVVSRLAEPQCWDLLGEAARATILERFDCRDCVPRALEILQAPPSTELQVVGAAASPQYSATLQ